MAACFVNCGVFLQQVYSLNTVSLYSSADVVIRDMVVFSGAGMGFYAQYVNNALLQSVTIAKRDTRPMSITADAAHFNTCQGLIEIRDSLFEGQGDDGACACWWTWRLQPSLLQRI